MLPDKILKIHSVAKELGVSIQTIKNFENAGILPKARRDNKGWRYYTQEDLIKIKALYPDAPKPRPSGRGRGRSGFRPEGAAGNGTPDSGPGGLHSPELRRP